MGIDDDGLRVFALGEADGKGGIVGEDGADADEDGVVGGAQGVCPLQRFGGTDGERFARLRRDGAVEALGVAQGDQGPSGALVVAAWVRSAAKRCAWVTCGWRSSGVAIFSVASGAMSSR